MMATAELVVPRSIPITEPLTFSSVDWNRAKRERVGVADFCKRLAESEALGSCQEEEALSVIVSHDQRIEVCGTSRVMA